MNFKFKVSKLFQTVKHVSVTRPSLVFVSIPYVAFSVLFPLYWWVFRQLNFFLCCCVSAHFFLCLAGADGTRLFPNIRQNVGCLSPNNSARHPPVIVTLQVESVALPMEYDSGAAVTLIPVRSFQSNFCLKFEPTSVVLQGV